ncbi:hypothetical protein LX36DRAFT_373239 [Colletotrichum falcatum]|nr:hypothetical protein LX36DRAFT_373239 [Colletotrichum falcatum]
MFCFVSFPRMSHRDKAHEPKRETKKRCLCLSLSLSLSLSLPPSLVCSRPPSPRASILAAVVAGVSKLASVRLEARSSVVLAWLETTRLRGGRGREGGRRGLPSLSLRQNVGMIQDEPFFFSPSLLDSGGLDASVTTAKRKGMSLTAAPPPPLEAHKLMSFLLPRP